MVEDTTPLRVALVKLMEADPVLAAACGSRIYGVGQPAQTEWPFIRYGRPIVTADEASDWTGGRHRVTIHVFARGPDETECNRLAARVRSLLDGQDVPLVNEDDPTREANVFELFANGYQLLTDGPDWHGVVECDVTVGGA
jgi:hypothetical protein